jgi:hypothetical protein
LNGYTNEKIQAIFKMGKQILGIFLDGATHIAVSSWRILKKTALFIETQNADWQKKIMTEKKSL